jgi:hypothetical protein
MRHISAGATAAIVVVIAQVLVAQTKMTPTAPGTVGDPVWQGIVRVTDGRTFVTDGGLAIDAAFAQPSTLPERVLTGKLLEDYLSAPHKDEYGFGDLKEAVSGRTYRTPSGIDVNATYIKYLQRILPRGARLRMTAPMQPIVILADGKAVGVLMPVKQ